MTAECCDCDTLSAPSVLTCAHLRRAQPMGSTAERRAPLRDHTIDRAHVVTGCLLHLRPPLDGPGAAVPEPSAPHPLPKRWIVAPGQFHISL